jgi:uncharacterized protein (UPF0261 family)
LRVVGISRDEGTSPAVACARAVLERAGLAVLVFEATGAGGLALEQHVLEGRLAGVLDLTTAELAAALLSGPRSAGADRLTGCALRGVPQVIVPGGLDGVCLGADQPEKARSAYPPVLLPSGERRIRTTPEENDALGKEIAYKASASRGPAVVLVPRGGFSEWDREGGPFWWPLADQTLSESLKHWMSPQVVLLEREAHINSPAFAEEAARLLMERM